MKCTVFQSRNVLFALNFFAVICAGLSPCLADTSTTSARPVQPLEEKPILIPLFTSNEGVEIADLDGDGKLDMISAVYKGHINFYKPKDPEKPYEFTKPVKLTDSRGKALKLNHW